MKAWLGAIKAAKGHSKGRFGLFSRYADRYVKQTGQWRIQHREIYLEFGNSGPGRKLGFGN